VRLPIKERAFSAAVVIPSVVIVVVLAALQYWWSTRLSEATAVRLADSLQMSMTNWQMDLFRDLLEVGLAMRTDTSDSGATGLDQYVRHLAEWRAVARYPDLVSSVYLLKSNETKDAQAFRLEPGARHFESAAVPPSLDAIRPALDATVRDLLRNYPPNGEPAGASSSLTLDATVFGMRGSSAGWLFEPGIPALLHPVISESQRGHALQASSVDWIAIELNPRVLRELLGELAQTYFQGTGGLDYEIAVVRRSSGGAPLYSSDAGFGAARVADADGLLDIFGRSEEGAKGLPVHVFHAPSDNKPPGQLRLPFFPLLAGTPGDADWELVVRHRRGGALGAFVADMRRRDLAISAGVLLLVGLNLAMLIATSQRARRLAQLQMNFVTAVSHELRTPLTVIMSGADNICNGVVETKQQMQQYGTVIGNQARQLFGLVERILLFASTRQGRHRFEQIPLNVADVVTDALASTAGLIEAGDVAVECDIEPELPAVVGDASALSQCLQNLITNALKYGKEKRWLRIHASTADNGDVEISVADRGIGIDREDLPHIFEPFYRSPAVRAAQIRGTGLGLPLSRSIAEAMKGKLTVTSSPGHGSIFTLHLPAAAQAFATRESAVPDKA
jgi:signal transduction histidine kinase